jgi:hypothetical protein
MPHVDLAFRLVGTKLPVDHEYALYSAINRLIPELHDAKNIEVHPVRGRYSGDGNLLLTPPADVKLSRRHPLPTASPARHRSPASPSVVFLPVSRSSTKFKGFPRPACLAFRRAAPVPLLAS